MRDRNNQSPLEDTEHAIRPYVLFIVMPLFALATAGADLSGGIGAAITHPVALGVAAGLALGKPLGIALMTLLGARILRAALPGTAMQVVGVGAIAGIGFTMSLFIGALAFSDPALQTPVRVGVYLGSLLAGAVGMAIMAHSLRAHSRPPLNAPDPVRPFLASDPDYLEDRSPTHDRV